MERIAIKEFPEGMFERLMSLENLIDNSTISINLLEIVRLRVSQINGCAFCVDMHHAKLKELGDTDLRLASLMVWDESPYFSKKERVVLAFTEALTKIDKGPVRDIIFNPLKNYFSKEEIVFLSLAIAQINTWTRLMKGFQITPVNFRPSEVLATVDK